MPSSAAAVSIGLDIGTSGVKALALDGAGRVLAHESAAYAVTQPRPGWAEQEPMDWWQATCEACRQLVERKEVVGRPIAAIGISGQMHGATLLDAAGRVLRPALIWADGRGLANLNAFAARHHDLDLLAITGSAPYASATLAKMLWLAEHESETLARAAHVLLAKDVVRYLLTGEFATDPSDASGTMLFDSHGGAWSSAILDRLRLDPTVLPPVLSSSALAGSLTAEAANATGLPVATPVAVGGGDAACAAYGLALGERASSPGGHELLVSVGTAGQVSLVVGSSLAVAHKGLQTLAYVMPERWQIMGAILSAGLGVSWLDRTTSDCEGAADEPAARIQRLLNEASAIDPGAAGLVFLPHLLGGRGPLVDATVRGAFVGLSPIHTRAHLARAVVEGVAFALRACVDVMRELDVQLHQALLVGAPAYHPLWRQVLANVLAMPIVIGESEHGSALGAARLAARATTGDPYLNALPRITRTTIPQAGVSRAYDEAYAIYQTLGTALRPAFHALGALANSSASADGA